MNSSIHEVESTLIEALLIVTLVVFAFLGSPRSVLIPVIAIPLSLVGTFAMMLLFGFSINLLTLLALVLSIGLVVDDAIIVVENVNRHLEDGMTPVAAALQAARELAGPIIAMTIVLIAVYVPIGFQGGLTGALFTEFAFTLVGAVTVSAIVALTLSPMLSSRLLKPHNHDRTSLTDRIVDGIDAVFDRVRRFYERWLHASLNYTPVTVVFAVLMIISIVGLTMVTQKELAPAEDQGLVLALSTPAPDATLAQKQLYAREVYKILSGYPEAFHIFQLDVPGQSIAGQVLKPWDERTRTSMQLQPLDQKQLSQVAGVQIAAFQQPPLPGSNGFPFQFVIGTTDNFEHLDEVSQQVLAKALASGDFAFLQSDLRIDEPQSTLVIDRDKAAQLGLKMSDVGAAMSGMMGGGYVNYFSLDGRSYKVIPQVLQKYRMNTDQLLDYHIRTASGASVPLSTIVSVKSKTVPESLNHFQQLNSATIQGVAIVPEGQALQTMTDIAKSVMPTGYSIDYGGETRQFVQESGGFLVTLGFAVIIIFLALAAQFESFRDPIIILISVPMSIAGAMIFITLLGSLGVGGATLNIYTEVGLVTLMGLISANTAF